MFELHGPAEYMESYEREEIVDFTTALLPGLEPESPEFRAAAVLLASLVECGPDERAAAELLGYEASWVRTVGQRLRDLGIWGPRGVVLEGVAGSRRMTGSEWWRTLTAYLAESSGAIGTHEKTRWPKGSDRRSAPRRTERCR